jgi:hypothetical protein
VIGATPSAIAGVLQVGDVALQLVGQIFEQRHAPKGFAGLASGVLELARKLVVSRVKRRTGLAKRNQGQRRSGSRRPRSGPARDAQRGECIGEHEATLSVGVDDLHRLTVERRENVRGPVRRSRPACSRRADDAVDLDIGTYFGNGGHQASTAAAPAMSLFISPMPGAGLMHKPPESNVRPLPTKHSFFFSFARHVGQVNEARLVFRYPGPTA